MPLNRVTLTGADDQTDITELLDLTHDFPFVEWGILVGSNDRAPRFPSRGWVHELVDVATEEDVKINLSLHVCGRWLRDIARGGSSLQGLIGGRLAAFGRCQLNWHGEAAPWGTSENILKAFVGMSNAWEPEIIFQLDGANNFLWKHAREKFLCSGLFDVSHGAGLLPAEWPQALIELNCGWAGGLGPDNLAAELPRIDAEARRGVKYWVDMETRLRDATDRFDLDKCKTCLQIAERFMNDPS